MAQVSKILRSIEGGGLMFHCPACDCPHTVWHGEGKGPRWGWNGDVDKPTFTPSLLLSHAMWTPPVTPGNLADWRRKPWDQHQVQHVCHSFVTDGRIQFLDDCTHYLAGQTLDLPDWT